jgi:hypothetical protein
MSGASDSRLPTSFKTAMIHATTSAGLIPRRGRTINRGYPIALATVRVVFDPGISVEPNQSVVVASRSLSRVIGTVRNRVRFLRTPSCGSSCRPRGPTVA